MIERKIPTKIGFRAVEANGIIFLSGAIADDKTQGMKGQTEQVCAKLEKVLAEVGSSKEQLVSAMIYVSDFGLKDEMNEAWLAWVPAEHLPTRACIGVGDLGPNVLVEIVLTAAR